MSDDPTDVLVEFLKLLPSSIQEYVVLLTAIAVGKLHPEPDCESLIDAISNYLSSGLDDRLDSYRCAMICGVVETILCETFDRSLSRNDAIAKVSPELASKNWDAAPEKATHMRYARTEFAKLRHGSLSPSSLHARHERL